jgi:hypothetical protein
VPVGHVWVTHPFRAGNLLISHDCLFVSDGFVSIEFVFVYQIHLVFLAAMFHPHQLGFHDSARFSTVWFYAALVAVSWSHGVLKVFKELLRHSDNF